MKPSRQPQDLTSPPDPSTAPVIAAVVSAGPNGEADDPATNMYWVKIQRATWNGATQGVEFEDDTSGCLGTIERAVNIAEPSTSHSVATGGTVYVELSRVAEPSNPPLFTWTFASIVDDIGERDGMIPQMTSQLTKGWGYLRLVNRPA